MSAGEAGDPWSDALQAAALLATDAELGGAILRALPGPARDAWLEAWRALSPPQAPLRRLPSHIDDERLLGGLDLTATLAANRPIVSRGLLCESNGGAVILSMAERCPPRLASILGAALDAGEVRLERDGVGGAASALFALIALDEGAEPEEAAPAPLAERLAFRLSLDGLRPTGGPPWTREEVDAARRRLRSMPPSRADAIEALCTVAGAFGVLSARASIFAVRAARASAALNGRSDMTDDDLGLAARLVLAPRALYAPPPDEAADPAPPDKKESETDRGEADGKADAERLVDAVRAALPADFMARMLNAGEERRARARSGGAGARARSAQRGRPLGARAGDLRAGDRLDLIATLRAAAPWQELRRREARDAAVRVRVRRSDFRIRRFLQRRESTSIFIVDASGSAAAQRLAEAKGAVETLLAEAYVTRARVAVLAFRDRSAEVLLPPTRSLARAKRCLAALPGGGGTPLAAAIDAALRLALDERAKGRTPLLVLLTDGRGNIARDGAPGRARAEEDSLAAARALRAAALPAVLIDTSPSARPAARLLAKEMGAAYAPLPFAQAGAVAEVVRAHAPVST